VDGEEETSKEAIKAKVKDEEEEENVSDVVVREHGVVELGVI
jgi:hypothetical protein